MSKKEKAGFASGVCCVCRVTGDGSRQEQTQSASGWAFSDSQQCQMGRVEGGASEIL